MSIQSEAALKFQSDVITRIDSATRKVLTEWQRVSVDDLDQGWSRVEPEITGIVSRAVAQNASSSQRMVNAVSRADGVSGGDVIVPNAFVGVDGSGRTTGGLLHGAVTTTKDHIGRGISPYNAFLVGSAYLAAMTKTAIADLSRSSAAVASAGKSYTRYVRVVNPGACSRCAILAGSDRFSKHFERHPACRCTSVPVKDDKGIPDGLMSSPTEHFWSLSEAEQNRIYGRAGAEAIRNGADPIQVVGARRGASGMAYSRARPNTPGQIRRMQRVQIGVAPDGSPIMGYVTIEGTSRRGTYGRAQIRIGEEFGRRGSDRYSRVNRARLMPETIMEMTSDPQLRRVLLRDAGYLQYTGTERLRMQQLDRITADTFYRSIGINLY